jgi:hypothetical protein
VDADDPDRAGLGHRLDGPLQGLARCVAGHPRAVRVLLRGDLRALLLELRRLLLGGFGGRPRLRPLRVDTDGVHDPVDADTAGQLLDDGDRVLGVEVDRLGATGARLVQPDADAVDHEHPAGALLEGAGAGIRRAVARAARELSGDAAGGRPAHPVGQDPRG